MVEKRRRKSAVKAPERSTLSLVLGDANALGLWVFLSSINEELTVMLADALGVPGLVAGLTVLCTTLALYDPVCALVGGQGASFNPSQNFAFAAAGQGSLTIHCLRSVAQTLGGVLGATAALRVIPQAWRGKFSNYAHGVVPGSSILEGALTEAALAFALNIVILWSIKTKHKTAAGLAPYLATVVLIPLGLATSGPFMNPAFAFSWFFHLRGANLWEHIAVYWLGCLAGSYLAGLAWWLFTTPAVPKRWKAKPRAAKPAASKARVASASGTKKQD